MVVVRRKSGDDGAADHVAPHERIRNEGRFRRFDIVDEIVLVVSEVWKWHQVGDLLVRKTNFYPPRPRIVRYDATDGGMTGLF